MAEADLLEQLTGFLGSEDGLRQLQNAARMLGLELPKEQKREPPPAQGGILPEGTDPQTVMKMMQLMQTARQETPSSAFLRALKPLLREERRERVDDAIRMMQLFSLLPVLKEMR